VTGRDLEGGITGLLKVLSVSEMRSLEAEAVKKVRTQNRQNASPVRHADPPCSVDLKYGDIGRCYHPEEKVCDFKFSVSLIG